MKTIYLSGQKFEYENLSELKDEFEKRNIKFGNGCELGDECELGNSCELGNECKLGNGCKLGYECKLGYWCELGNGCELGYSCKLGDRCKLGKSPFYAIALYKYHVSAHWDKSIPYVQLGCYLRTVEEWEANFWNNTIEFLDHESKESKDRLFAFDMAKQWLENNKI